MRFGEREISRCGGAIIGEKRRARAKTFCGRQAKKGETSSNAASDTEARGAARTPMAAATPALDRHQSTLSLPPCAPDCRPFAACDARFRRYCVSTACKNACFGTRSFCAALRRLRPMGPQATAAAQLPSDTSYRGFSTSQFCFCLLTQSYLHNVTAMQARV